MQRVTGIGGIFFKSRDPKALCAWYRDHLGLDVTDWGGAVFQWGGPDSAPGTTIWSVFPSDTSRMEPGDASFMLNFRVADLDALLAALREQKIGGAALDVFPNEPLQADSPLWKLPNVIITPHVAGFSAQYDGRAMELFSENLQRYLSGLPLLNRISLENKY